MLHRIVIVLLIACLLAASVACGPKSEEQAEQPQPETQLIEQTEPQTQLPNPVVEVADANAFAPLGVQLEAPEGATELHYTIISDMIAQIQFTYEDRSYAYRAARSGADIAGVYETFDEEAIGLDASGDDWNASITIKTIAQGEEGALVTWSYPPAQFTLFTSDACDVDELAELGMSLASTSYPRAAESAETIEKKLSVMQPVLDSILRCIGIEGETAWSSENAERLWDALYLMGANWGQTDERVSVEGGNVVVPAAVMRAWAYALTGTDTIPAIPKSMTQAEYDQAKDVYLLEASDMGDSETRVDYSDKNEDGTYQVLLGLYDADGVRLGGLLFMLEEGSIDGSPFAYSVRSVALESLDG